MEAPKVIGKIELWVKMNKIPVMVTQNPQDKDMGVTWSKIKIPLNHDKSHHIVAYNHAVFFRDSRNDAPDRDGKCQLAKEMTLLKY
jgi:hypothetical protein